MIKTNRILAFAVSTFILVSLVGCKTTVKTDTEIKNTIVAKVNDEPITLEQVDISLGLLLDQVITYYGDDYKDNEDAIQFLVEKRYSMLDTLINDIIYKSKAIELGIMPTAEELNAKADEELLKIRQTFWTEEEYETALNNIKFTEAQLKDELKSSIIYELVYAEATKHIKPTEEQIHNYYEENKNTYTTNPNKIHIAHILVNDSVTANEIISKLNNGADFAELSSHYGTDTSKDVGGDLGWVEYSSKSIDNTLLSSAIQLEIGEFSSTPVETEVGFHVIMCLDKEIYPIQPLDQVKDKIIETLSEDKRFTEWAEIIKRWQDEFNIKVYTKYLKQLY